MNSRDFLIKNKYQHIFFSPHIDDAVLSCGGLIIYVFTGINNGKTSKFGKNYIKACGFQKSKILAESQKIEEKRASEILKYDCFFLDFPEAIFRFRKFFFLKGSSIRKHYLPQSTRMIMLLLNR